MPPPTRLCWERSFIHKQVPNPLLIIVGPTASGKTAVACEIAKHLPVEMISCDSMQVYRSMPLLTQAPTAQEKKILKMHLVSFLHPSEEYNAALFRKDAMSVIEKIQKKKYLPMVVGGTGLYLRALMDGLFEAEGDDGRDEKLRKKLIREQNKRGGNYLHEKLKKVDVLSAARIHPNDIRRLVRALEVYHVTGRTFSDQKPERQGIRDSFQYRLFLLDRDRQDLYDRIHRRVDEMVKNGVLTEVKKLCAKYPKPGRTASMALGFREMKMVLEKRSSLAEALELLKKNTRHYAKRQLSWFRHEKGVEPVAVGQNETAKETAEKILRLWKQR